MINVTICLITKKKLYRVLKTIRSRNLNEISREKEKLKEWNLLEEFVDSDKWADVKWPHTDQNDLYLDGRINHFKEKVKSKRLVIGF